MSPPRWLQSTVCRRCAKIKQVCDGNTPCSRCTRLDLPCQPRSSLKDYTTDPDGENTRSIQVQPKARIRRVQTGCMTCKKRRKKCDERKPTCSDCERLHLDCTWKLEQPRTYTDNRRAESNSMSTSLPVPDTVPWMLEDMDHMDQTNAPSQFDAASVPFPFLIDENNDNNTSHGDVPHRFSIDNSMFDLELISAGAVDVPNDSQDSATPDPDAGSAVISAATPNSISLNVYIPSILPDLTSLDDKALYNHYSAVVTNTLCRRMGSKEANPYITYILPMAIANTTIRHCILALSASHWRGIQPRLSDRGLYHQNKATQELSNMLSVGVKESANIELAACLLLCMTEIFDGESTGWKHHLQGAKRLLANTLTTDRVDHGTQTGFLVGLARYLDSATTTTTCAPPVIDGDDNSTALFRNMSLLSDDFDAAVYGIPKALFHLVDRVNSLAQKRKTRVDVQSENDFRRETALVEDLLDHWSFEYGGLSQAVATLCPSTELNCDVLQATTAYEWALRLRLHQIKNGYALIDSYVPKVVDRILSAVQDIRYGSPLEGCLLFPLVMAGGACESMEHRYIIQNRLMVMERTCGFGYIYRARELMEKVWQRRDALEGTGAIVNWARLRFEEMNGLVIF